MISSDEVCNNKRDRRIEKDQECNGEWTNAEEVRRDLPPGSLEHVPEGGGVGAKERSDVDRCGSLQLKDENLKLGTTMHPELIQNGGNFTVAVKELETELDRDIGRSNEICTLGSNASRK